MSKLKASTRKLASKLGIGHHKKDRGRGVGTPTSTGSPRAESPIPASPAGGATPAAGAEHASVATPFPPGSPLAPVTPGMYALATPGVEAPLQLAAPLAAAAPLRAGSPYLAAGGGTESPRGRSLAEDLEGARERLAALRSVAERAAHLAPGGAASPRAAGSPRQAAQAFEAEHRSHAGQAAAHLLGMPPSQTEHTAPAGVAEATPRSGRPASSAVEPTAEPPTPTTTTPAAQPTAKPAGVPQASERVLAAAEQRAAAPGPTAMAAASPLESSNKQRRRVDATALGTGYATRDGAPVADAAAAERLEQRASEGLAAFRPASPDTRRGRLLGLVAQASPYLGPLPGGAEPAAAGSPLAQAGQGAEAGEAEGTGAAAPGPWQEAAEQPEAAAGGRTGTTHVGGPAELDPARLHRRREGASAQEEAEGEAAQPRPSPTDIRKGQGLAAADVAAGRHAATDAAAVAAEEARTAGTAGQVKAAPEEAQPLLEGEGKEAEAQAGAGQAQGEGVQAPRPPQPEAAGSGEARPEAAGAAARAAPTSPASAPSPSSSGVAALQDESAKLLEQEAALAPAQGQQQMQEGAEGPEGPAQPGRAGPSPAAAPAARPAARVTAQREGREPAAGLQPAGEQQEVYSMGPSLERPPSAQELAAPLTVGTERAPSQPLLPAGAFSQAQDISVFSPRQPEVYEVRDQEVDLATQVVPSGAAATVGPTTALGAQLAPLAAGDEPARLEAGPFGAAEDISVFAPSAALPEEEGLREAPEMDRSTEEEEVDIQELAGHLGEQELERAGEAPMTATAQQAAGTAAQTGAAAKEAASSAAATAAHAARVTVERVAAVAGAAAGAVAGAASQLGTAVSEKATAATEAAAETAEAAAEKASAAKETVSEAAGQVAGATVEKAAAAKETVSEAAGQVAEATSEKAAAAREAGAEAAGAAAEKAVSAKDTATSAAGDAADAAGAVAGAVVDKAAMAREAVSDTAAQAGDVVAKKAAAATEATGAAAGSAAESMQGVAAPADEEASREAVDFERIAVDTGGAPGGRPEAAVPSVPAEIAAAEEGGGPAVEQAAEEAAREAAGPTTGLAATLLGVATHAMHAVTEGLHNVLESGRQLAAEADAGSAELAASGGSTAAGSEAGNGAEGGVGEEGAAGAEALAVLPASPQTQEQSMKEAVEGDETVSSSLLPALEGAAEPAQLSAPAMPATTRAMPASPRRPAAGSGQAAEVLPVAVGNSDKQTAREAAMHSTQVDASLAVEQEAPEVGEAELAEQEAAAAAQASGPGTSQGSPASAAWANRGRVLPVAVTAEDRQTARQAATRSPAVDASLAAEQEAPDVGEAELRAAAAAQPEGLDATKEYLAERTEARQQSGLGAGSRPVHGEQAALAGGSEDSESRLRMKDISGLGTTSKLAEPAPSSKDTGSEPASEGAASEPWQEPEPKASSGSWSERDRQRERALTPQFSVGGLREPPPSPTASSSPPATASPVGGGPGDVPRPSRLAVVSSAPPGEVTGAAEGGPEAGLATAAEGPGAKADLREAVAAEGLEQAAEAVKAEAAKGLQAEASEGSETLVKAVGSGAAGMPRGLAEGAASGGGEGAGPPTLDRIDTAGSSTGETAGAPAALQRLETGTSMGGSEPGEVEDVPIPIAITPLGRARHVLQVAMSWVQANPMLAAGGGVLLASLLWAVLVRLAVEVLGEFGPALAMAATIAVVGSAVAWLARYVRLQDEEIAMVQQSTLGAPSTGAGAATAAPAKPGPAAGAGGPAPAEAPAPTVGELEALPTPPGATSSEPVSAESTEDLRRGGGDAGAGGAGILQAAKHAVEDAAEGAMEAVEPGREQVGEVIQETESGEEEVEGDDVLGSAVRAVTGAAAAATRKLGEMTDRAYRAISKEAPGADVSGEGASIKSLGTAPAAVEEQHGRLEPASVERAPRPPPATGGGEEPASGYESGGPGYGAASETAEQAGATHHQATEGSPAETAGEGAHQEPATAADAPQGRLGRAAEAASELAASAVGRVKHATAVATGTAEEQRPAGQQLADLQRSIADMEADRAGDVQFEKAGKQLGL
ncbi:hypothetical protein ABPG77_006222 [Micractinium sp. CCAP 211/92]